MADREPVVYHRANGDRLSLLFAPAGSLSSVRLQVRISPSETRRDGAVFHVYREGVLSPRDLPCLREDNATSYLGCFHWLLDPPTSTVVDVAWRVAWALGEDYMVAAVYRKPLPDGPARARLALAADRERACPRGRGQLIVDAGSDLLRAFAVDDVVAKMSGEARQEIVRQLNRV